MPDTPDSVPLTQPTPATAATGERVLIARDDLDAVVNLVERLSAERRGQRRVRSMFADMPESEVEAFRRLRDLADGGFLERLSPATRDRVGRARGEQE